MNDKIAFPVTRADLFAFKDYGGIDRDTTGNPCVWENDYSCEACGNAWADRWSCACNDRCPACGAEISPFRSRYIGPQGAAAAAWRMLPEAL